MNCSNQINKLTWYRNGGPNISGKLNFAGEFGDLSTFTVTGSIKSKDGSLSLITDRACTVTAVNSVMTVEMAINANELNLAGDFEFIVEITPTGQAPFTWVVGDVPVRNRP